MKIDPREFSWWFSKRARNLLDSTVSAHMDSYEVRQRKYWLVYIGTHAEAEKDYFEIGRDKGIWAFRYAVGENLAKIMSVMKGDVIVFTSKWKTARGREIYPGGNWSCSHIDIFPTTRGYYCDLKDRTFEPSSWDGTPEGKEYMHYFRFKKTADRERLYSEVSKDSPVRIRGADFSKQEILRSRTR